MVQVAGVLVVWSCYTIFTLDHETFITVMRDPVECTLAIEKSPVCAPVFLAFDAYLHQHIHALTHPFVSFGARMGSGLAVRRLKPACVAADVI